MKCPRCGGHLAPFGTSEGVELDFCSDCSGMLFDQGEVAEYFELSKDIPDLTTDLKQARKSSLSACPKCGGNWVEIPYAPSDNLLIDLCTQCGAVWLDKGEFPKLEKMAVAMEDPKSKLLRATQLIERRGYQVIGWKTNR
jgi:Zn-finger nucleic acid-binding protein